MPSSAKLILFTGAPSVPSLTEASCVVDAFEKPFQDLLGLETTTAASSSSALSSAQRYAAWRSLSLLRRPLHTGLSQAQVSVAATANSNFFVISADTTAFEEDEVGRDDTLTQFCEHSLAVHDEGAGDAFADTSFATTNTTTTTSSASVLSEEDQEEENGEPRPVPPEPGHLSDLEDVPSARQVTLLHPQTITVNLIVGVLSVDQPRSVTTRWGSTLSLVEVLVGDETAAGFAVTFWLPTDSVAGSHVAQLRRQDVVLMENVALHVFRDKVYGQSLRRGLTRLHLLWRADGSGCYSSRALARAGQGPLGPQQRDKTRLVRDWVIRFAGSDPKAAVATNRAATAWDRPPDDTPS